MMSRKESAFGNIICKISKGDLPWVRLAGHL